MSWIPGGLSRLLKGHSSEQQTVEKAPAAAVAQGRATLQEQHVRPTAKSGRRASGTTEAPTPGQMLSSSNAAQTGKELHNRLLTGPGRLYAQLPCLKQRFPSASAADRLAQEVQWALPGVQLDDSWVVYPACTRNNKHLDICIVLPQLQPQGYFRSKQAVINFLQQLQGAGVPLPGVTDQPLGPTSPTSMQRQTAAVTAALLSVGRSFRPLEHLESRVRSSTNNPSQPSIGTGSGSGSTYAVAKPANSNDTAAAACAAEAAAAVTADGGGAGEVGGPLTAVMQVPEKLLLLGQKRLREDLHEQQQQQQHQHGVAADAEKGDEQEEAGMGAADGAIQLDTAIEADASKRSRLSLAEEDSADVKASSDASRPGPQVAASPVHATFGAALGAFAAAVAAAAGGEDDIAGPTAIMDQDSQEQRQEQQQQQPEVSTRLSDGHPAAANAQQQQLPMSAQQQQQKQGVQGEQHPLYSQQQDQQEACQHSALSTLEEQASQALRELAQDWSQQQAVEGRAAAAAAEAQQDKPEWELQLHRLQSLRSAALFATGQFRKPSRAEAKLQSLRRAAFAIGKEPSVSAALAAPLPPKQQMSPAAAAAAPAKPYSVDLKPPKQLPPKPKPRPSSSSGGSRPAGNSSGGGGAEKSSKAAAAAATNTFTAASDVKAMSKLDSLRRAAEAAAAMKAAHEAGMPYEGTAEQRHYLMTQRLKLQLPDGRVPCAEGMEILQQQVSAQLPGARLDREWLVYPASGPGVVPKMDIYIRHPKITLGYFRSYRSVVTFYTTVTNRLKGPRHMSSKYYKEQELVVPGLSVLPTKLEQEHRRGRSPSDMQALVQKGVEAAGRAFIRRASNPAAGAGGGAGSGGGKPSSSSGGGGGGAAGSGHGGSGGGAGAGGAGPVNGGKIGTAAAAANAAAMTVRQWQPPPFIANLAPPEKGSSVLVLGMFYASEATAAESHTGLAQYRDRVRLAALHRQLGYQPHSFDRDHEAELAQVVTTTTTTTGSGKGSGGAGSQDQAAAAAGGDAAAAVGASIGSDGGDGHDVSDGGGDAGDGNSKDEAAAAAAGGGVEEDSKREQPQPQQQLQQQFLHVQGNFNSRRGAAAVSERYPTTRFSAVLLDYFRMPSGYAGDIYKAQLFLEYIPELVRRGNLPAGVPIYIPNSKVLLEQLAASGAFADYGDVVAIPARSNPLYEATRIAEAAGQMPAKYHNAGQVRELVPGAEFVVVHYCGDATYTPPVGS